MFFIYPAVFKQEFNHFSVSFPDLPGCTAYGTGQDDALLAAENALATWLELDDSSTEKTLPLPSDMSEITGPENGFVSLVRAAYHSPVELGMTDIPDDAEDLNPWTSSKKA